MLKLYERHPNCKIVAVFKGKRPGGFPYDPLSYEYGHEVRQPHKIHKLDASPFVTRCESDAVETKKADELATCTFHNHINGLTFDTVDVVHGILFYESVIHACLDIDMIDCMVKVGEVERFYYEDRRNDAKRIWLEVCNERDKELFQQVDEVISHYDAAIEKSSHLDGSRYALQQEKDKEWRKLCNTDFKERTKIFSERFTTEFFPFQIVFVHIEKPKMSDMEGHN